MDTNSKKFKGSIDPWDRDYEEEIILREATEDEINLLKTIIFINGFNDGVVAGGYAAWVNGLTTSYSDIDCYFKETRLMMRSRLQYNFTTVNRIENDGFYQRIFTIYKEEWLGVSDSTNKQLFLEFILRGFDLPICKVGYYYAKNEKKFMCMTMKQKINNKKVLALCTERMIKYNKRCKQIPSLKWLAITACKQHKVEDLKEFIKSINIVLDN